MRESEVLLLPRLLAAPVRRRRASVDHLPGLRCKAPEVLSAPALLSIPPGLGKQDPRSRA